MTQTIVTGFRSTGLFHIGNFLGAARPFIEFQHQPRNKCFAFVADLHAVTEIETKTDVVSISIELAKTLLACGIGPPHCCLYRQSDIPEIVQIAQLLGNVVPLGQLRLCTTFKDRVRNKRVPESNVSLGLLTYPVLMAADIYAPRAQTVPVGHDQMQHIEMTRTFARQFNRLCRRDVLTIPSSSVQRQIQIPGIDGKGKMGKSDGNAIAVLESTDSILRKIRRIPTQSAASTEMSAGTKALFALVEHCSSRETFDMFLGKYQDGEEKFFAEMKTKLAEDVDTLVSPIRARYRTISNADVDDILRDGASRVREIAGSVLDEMRAAIGLRN